MGKRETNTTRRRRLWLYAPLWVRYSANCVLYSSFNNIGVKSVLLDHDPERARVAFGPPTYIIESHGPVQRQRRWRYGRQLSNTFLFHWALTRKLYCLKPRVIESCEVILAAQTFLGQQVISS